MATLTKTNDQEEEEKENNKPKEPSINEKLLKTRQLTLFDAISSKVAKEFIQGLFLLEADDPKKEIFVYLNSPGGSVNSGYAIYDAIRFVKPEVKIICTGLCASIATVILQAPKKENRMTMPNCEFMIHQPLIQGGINGAVSDIEITADEIVKTRSKLNKLLAEETGQPIDTIEKDTDRDFWMTATHAVEYGLVTKIVEDKSSF